MESFIVEACLETRPYQNHIFEKAFKYARIITIRLIARVKKKIEIFDNLDDVKSLREKLKVVKDPTKKKNIISALSIYRKQCDLSRFDIIKDIKDLYKSYNVYITSQMSQSIAKRVDSLVSDYIENTDVEIKYPKRVNSIESESITNGIKFNGTHVIYKDMLIPIKVKNDSYFYTALNTCNLKYIRIVKRFGKTKPYYIAQFVFKGEPIASKKIEIGSGAVGIDIGTSTIAYSSNNEVKVEELSKELTKIDNEIAEVNKKLDRSRRATNKDNFKEDGTVKEYKDRHPWNKSKNYRKLSRRKRYLSNKFVNQRKNLYEHQVNELLTKGDTFIIEPMNYKALQRRAKETTKDENGKFKKKARFGKSILKHAPSLFVSILTRKLGYIGMTLYKVNNQTFKASQYDHYKDEYIKCDLDTRTKDIGGHMVQRDLYSAFLLMNANDDLQTVNKQKCKDRFSKFLSLHEIEMNRLSKQKNISCIGV